MMEVAALDAGMMMSLSDACLRITDMAGQDDVDNFFLNQVI